MPRTQRTSDHRLVRPVQDAGDVTIATRIGVPRSTVAGWLRRVRRPIAAAPGADTAAAHLRQRVARLGKTVERIRVLLHLPVADQARRLAAAKMKARAKRLEVNRPWSCAS